jgi:hypothetical protein
MFREATVHGQYLDSTRTKKYQLIFYIYVYLFPTGMALGLFVSRTALGSV